MRCSSLAFGIVLVLALLACKGGSASSAAGSSSGKAGNGLENEPDEPIGKIAGLTPDAIEARAKKAGFRQKTYDDDKADGISVHSFELESDDNYAYVSLVDVGAASKAHAFATGDTAALVVDIQGDKPDAALLLKSLLERHPLAATKKATLQTDLEALKWKVASSSSDSQDGVTTVSIYADRGDDALAVAFYDFRMAKSEGRLVAEGNRFLNVFVCQDCIKRKEGLLTDLSNRRKAKKLLARLTKP